MPSFNIAGRGKMWFIISLLVIVPGLITGGTIIDLKFAQPVGIAQVRESLKPFGLDGATIQLSGESSDVATSTDVMIRTVDLEETQRKEVMAAIREKVGSYEVLREEKVGAVIGGELILNAVLALVISWVLIILYVAYRFEFRFGIAAVAALRQVDSSFVAALLTVVGYSINDTIVIFDRIRENLKLHFRRGGNVVALVNRSIYQTLTRSLYTVFTCLFTTFALFFFGGETTKDFAFALIVGFMSGCYSSIFIAGPLWLELRKFGSKSSSGK